MFGDKWLLPLRVVCWGTTTSIMYFGWVLLLLNGGEGWIHRFLGASFWRRIATLGYGVYLVRVPVCDHAIAPLARFLSEDKGAGPWSSCGPARSWAFSGCPCWSPTACTCWWKSRPCD
jgi:hypothetical protein